MCYYLGIVIYSQLLKMQLLEDDEELAYQSKKEKMTRQISAPDARPAWMRQLLRSVSDWLKMVPQVTVISYQHMGVLELPSNIDMYNKQIIAGITLYDISQTN